jgi:hypothetical protein
MSGAVRRSRVKSDTYPEHVGILQVSLGIPLLGVNEVGELGRITDEEHWRVVVDPVPVALWRTDLDGETTGVASSVSRARLATDCRESDGELGLLTNGAEEWRRGDIGAGVGESEGTMGTSTLGVHNTLWNPLPIKVSKKIDVVEV